MIASGLKSKYQHRFAYADAFRALAIIGVIFGHTVPQIRFGQHVIDISIVPNVFVNMFFILTGYLLCRPFFRAILSGADFPDVAKFFKKRVLRIYPAYAVAVVASLAVNPYPLNPVSFVLTHLLFLHGFILDEITAKNVPLWTMAIDAQFYVLLPLISFGCFSAMKKIAPSARLVTLYVLLGFTIMLSVVWPTFVQLPAARPEIDPSALSILYYRNIICLAEAFAFGCLIGLTELHANSLSQTKALSLLTLTALVAILDVPLYTVWINSPLMRVGYQFFIVLTLALIFASFSTGCITQLNGFVKSKAVRLIAEFSYSLYLVHWICVSVLEKQILPRFPNAHLPAALVHIVGMAILTVPCAWLLNRFVERPFMRMKNRIDHSASSSTNSA